jgi:hypothetical protein
LEVSNAFGCSSVSTTIVISDAIGINELSNSLMASIYPNPTSENLFIDFNSKKADVVTLSIMDISGREVYGEKINLSTGMNRKQINTNVFNKGIYLVQFITENGVKSEKLIIQ